MKKLRYTRSGILCLFLFFVAIGCRDDLDKSVKSINPRTNASARVSSNNTLVENELLDLERSYGIAFTNTEVAAIDAQPDPLGAARRIRAALEEFGNATATYLESRFQQLWQPFESITQGEKNILSSTSYGYRIALLLYVLDAVEATGIAGSTCDDCKENAVKHAYFRVANGWSFNGNVSKMLGEAHEAGLVGASTTMDTHNNNQGLIVHSIVGRFMQNQAEDEINTRLINGSLRYVDGGVVKPTNQ